MIEAIARHDRLESLDPVLPVSARDGTIGLRTVLPGCFASLWLLEPGVRLPVIQILLGHNHISTTIRYLHVTEKHLSTVKSPFDLLRLPRAIEDLGR